MCLLRTCRRSSPTISWRKPSNAFGIVLSASITSDPATGKRLRYGFVDIATERAAKRAVESMNGTAVEGYNLDVRISEKPDRPQTAAAASRAAPCPAAPAATGGWSWRRMTGRSRPLAFSGLVRSRENSRPFRSSAGRCLAANN